MQLRGAGRRFLFMLAVTAAVFFLLQAATTRVIGLLGAVGFLGGWTLLNRRARTTGLVKVSVRAYFEARGQGASHDEALRRTVESRYPNSPKQRTAVRTRARNTGDVNPGPNGPLPEEEATELKTLVYAVLVNENGPPLSESSHRKILGYIGSGYAEVTADLQGMDAGPRAR